MLKMKYMSMRLVEYGTDKGRYQGEIDYVGDVGKISVTLSPADCEKILPIVAEGLVATSREVAEALTKEALSSLPADKMKIA